MKIVAAILIIAPIVSLFIWAGFNIQWWSPEIGEAQEITLMMFHVFSPIVGAYIYFETT